MYFWFKSSDKNKISGCSGLIKKFIKSSVNKEFDILFETNERYVFNVQ